MSVVISSIPAQGNDEWRRRCYHVDVNAPEGEDQDISQSYEMVRYINGEKVARTLNPEQIVPAIENIQPTHVTHKMSEIVPVVCLSGRTLGMAIEDILWCNDHMDEVDAQIAAFKAAKEAAQVAVDAESVPQATLSA